MERLSHNHTDNSDELLSAYIDNAVDAGERRRAEQLIAACAACAQEVQELRMFRELMRDLPNIQPRRSFTLDPATVAPQRRLLFPTLRWSSLVAALLFVVVLGVDVLGGSPQSAMPAAAPAAESAAKGYPQQFDSVGAGGGSANSMMAQSSPASSPPADPGNAESADAPFTAEAPAASASPAASAASDAALPEASASPEAAPAASPAASEAPVAAAAPPAASESPVARNAETAAALIDPAGGAAAQPQMGLRANEPAGADTIQLSQDEPAQGSWWSSYGLRIAEVALGLIALVLGGAAIWTWRRQL
ncbi:MAG TPA: zf-HC2 domain-containing protein [Herpetosiphonaceae bacterium]